MVYIAIQRLYIFTVMLSMSGFLEGSILYKKHDITLTTAKLMFVSCK